MSIIETDEDRSRLRVQRYTEAKAEWEARKAAQATGQPEPESPTLDSLRPHQRRTEAKFWADVRAKRAKGRS